MFDEHIHKLADEMLKHDMITHYQHAADNFGFWFSSRFATPQEIWQYGPFDTQKEAVFLHPKEGQKDTLSGSSEARST